MTQRTAEQAEAVIAQATELVIKEGGGISIVRP
jgi:hypothetical protein